MTPEQIMQRVQRLEMEVEDQGHQQLALEALVSNHMKSVSELSAQVHRLAVAVEGWQKRVQEQQEATDRRSFPPPPPEARSWHQSLRAKRVSPLSAGSWAAVLYAVAELVRAIADGRIQIHF